MSDKMVNTDLTDLQTLLERYIKAGRISFSLLTWDNKSEAKENELIIKYDNENAFLYIKNADGKIVSVNTETDLSYQEFLAKFMEVSSAKEKAPFDPQLWFKINEDASMFSGYSQENISYFYNYIENNLTSLKPYIINTTADGENHEMLPFMSTRTVYYDLGKIIKDGNIVNVEDTISAIMNLVNNIKSEITDMLNINIRNYDDTLNEFQSHIDRQNEEISVLHSAVSTVDKKYTDLTAKVKEISDKMDLKIRSKKFTLSGDSNRIVPVIIWIGGGGEDLPTEFLNSSDTSARNPQELFLGGAFITYTDPNRNVILQLGSGMETNEAANIHGGTEFTVTQNGNTDAQGVIYGQGVIHGVQKKHAGHWLVWLLAGKTYYLWSKYVDYIWPAVDKEYLGTNTSLYNWSNLTIPQAYKLDYPYYDYYGGKYPQQVFYDRRNAVYSFHYTDVLNITHQLTLGSRYVLSIVQ